jgi:predicted transcriptional regulator
MNQSNIKAYFMFGIQLRPRVSDCCSLSLRYLCDRDFKATVTPPSLLIVLHKYTGEKWFGLKHMRTKRSKLELYIEILNTLGQRRTQELTSILDKINTSDNFLKERMGHLIKQGLIEQRNIEKQVAYNNTQRGIIVLGYFNEHLQESPNRRRFQHELLPESVPSLI